MTQGRKSGILLHISSLPSPFGIGDLGEGAYRFVDFLEASRQGIWQILPLTPTMGISDNSPYMTLSSFAGNPLFISPELLLRKGLLRESDLEGQPTFPRERVEYPSAIKFKEETLATAWRRFQGQAGSKHEVEWEGFCRDNSYWLDDFALFMALKAHFHGASWAEWPRGFRDRKADDLRSAKEMLAEEIGREKFCQYLFFSQWEMLKSYCRERGILIIGDMPIYAGYDTADAWSHPEIFQLDREKRPAAVSGVPPDMFSSTGQRWGHPLYRWNVMRKTGYDWLIRRIEHHAMLFDMVRIDHFRGFVNYWSVPAREKTALQGRWVAAPALDFFKHLTARIPSLSIMCEDLGASPPEFRDVMDHFGFPGMMVLLFAFGSDMPQSLHAPHHHIPNSVVYTGTHDNNTIKGWFRPEASSQDRRRLAQYLGKRVFLKTLHWDVVRLAMMSVSRIAIFPMQDILGLGGEARMNYPGTKKGNWTWRVPQDYFAPGLVRRLAKMTTLYGRSGK